MRAYRDYRGLFDAWSYWAPGKESKVEVDFLLQHGRTSVALEVKASRQFSDRGLRGLRAIAALPGVRRRIVVYLGERRMRTADGIDVLPLCDFLHQVEQGRLF